MGRELGVVARVAVLVGAAVTGGCLGIAAFMMLAELVHIITGALR